MTEALYPKPDRVMAQRRSALAPKIDAAFQQFSQAVFQDGALSRKEARAVTGLKFSDADTDGDASLDEREYSAAVARSVLERPRN